MNKATIIEMAPFEVAEGVTTAQLLNASHQLEEGFLGKCEGYIARSLVKTGENKYMDIVYWASLDDAQKASENIFESAYCNAYFACMRMEEGVEPQIMHYEIVGSYSK